MQGNRSSCVIHVAWTAHPWSVIGLREEEEFPFSCITFSVLLEMWFVIFGVTHTVGLCQS